MKEERNNPMSMHFTQKTTNFLQVTESDADF